MAKFLDHSGLSKLVDSFKDDINASTPVYFGKLDVVSSDVDNDLTLSLSGTSTNDELETVTVVVCCNDESEVNIICETDWSE